jgi:hypothetical protein
MAEIARASYQSTRDRAAGEIAYYRVSTDFLVQRHKAGADEAMLLEGRLE